MVYYANGGFNWHDVYFMPTKLREFYWRELLKTKDTEKDSYEKAASKAKGKQSITKSSRN
jgi:hypothetical protein